MERKDLYIEYRKITIEKGINPIGKKRFNGIIDVLQEIKQCDIPIVGLRSEQLPKNICVNCGEGDDLPNFKCSRKKCPH